MFTVQHHLEDKLLAQICYDVGNASQAIARLVLASRVGSNCALNFLEVFDILHVTYWKKFCNVSSTSEGHGLVEE